MTVEEKQLMVKAIEKGIPAIAQEHLRALDEVEHIAESEQESLEGAEGFKILNQSIHDTIIKVLIAAYPLMADEVVAAYVGAVNECLAKFNANIQARQAREEGAEKEIPSEEEAEVPSDPV